MSSECEYDWYWKISACSTEYEVTCPKPTVPKKEIYLTNHDQRGKEKGLFLILLFFYWPEAIHMTFHFLTYWLAKSNFCAISICYLDVNWLIPKILACRTRIWSLLASERSERVTSFIFCRAGWYFSVSICFFYHLSLRLYLPVGSIRKTCIKVRVSWAGLINSEQELSPNSPNI
jgi:hypothetical protein